MHDPRHNQDLGGQESDSSSSDAESRNQKREQGDEDAATTLLGRAVQLAHESGHDELTVRLRKVVDVVDPTTGTVRLRRSVEKAAEMDLALEATTTKRMRRTPAGGT